MNNNCFFLVNPSEQGILETAGDRLPLGLLYIGRKWQNKQAVRVYDLNHSRLKDLVEDVRKLKPTIVGISCLTTPMVNQTNEIIRSLEGLGTRTVVGGYHPSVMPFDFPMADAVLKGEGEDTMQFPKLVNEAKPTDLKGLTPDRKLLDNRAYNMKIEGLRASTCITSRGCPNNCVFCGNPNKQVRFHELEDVAKDLEEIKRQNYDAVYFLDDVFTILPSRAKYIGSLCKEIGLKYRATTRANYTNEDLISHLSETGCICLSLGVETGNEEILRGIGKNQTKDQIRNAVNLCTKYNIPTKGFFIIGLPGENDITAKQTIDFSLELREKGMKTADFYPLIPFPGTEIWTNPEKFKMNIIDKNYRNYLQVDRDNIHVPAETYYLKAEQIANYIREARDLWA